MNNKKNKTKSMRTHADTHKYGSKGYQFPQLLSIYASIFECVCLAHNFQATIAPNASTTHDQI